MLYRYYEAFSSRDEIGSCPYIEVEINITDKYLSLCDLIMSRKKIKISYTRKWKRLCNLGILKEGFSAYSSQVMFISRKVMKDKQVVTDFRHLNVRIAKNNLAYPLLKDTFSVLHSCRCKGLLVLHFKDAFHSLRLSKIQQRVQDITIFW